MAKASSEDRHAPSPTVAASAAFDATPSQQADLILRLARARWIKRATDIAGFVVVLLGLYFTYSEARRSNAGQNLTNWSEVTSRMLDIERVLVEYPDYQKYIYDGFVVRSTEKEYARAHAISVMELDFFDSVTSRIAYNRRHLSDDLLQHEAWHHYIRATLKTAPLMCTILLADPESYGTEMRRIGLPPCREAAAERRNTERARR
jgi:hypothetical protein